MKRIGTRWGTAGVVGALLVVLFRLVDGWRGHPPGLHDGLVALGILLVMVAFARPDVLGRLAGVLRSIPWPRRKDAS